jgi:hypothetical protein
MTLPKYSQSEQTTPTTYPQADWQGLFFDSSDSGKLKRIDDAGTVVSIEDVSGTVGLDQGGTGADLSAGQGVLVQATSGANVSALGGTGVLKLASGAPSVGALARADLPSFMGVTAYLSTSQSVAPGPRTLVNLDTILFDTDSGFNTTTHKYTIPVAGYWLFVCSALFFTSTYGFTSFYVDGTTEFYATELNLSSGSNSVGSLGILSLSQGQTVDMRVITKSTINVFRGANYTYLSAIWLGA